MSFSIICSDAMARGMDIDNVKYVISYDPPPYIKTYVHRIGRTARAGKVGSAITLLQKKEVSIEVGQDFGYDNIPVIISDYPPSCIKVDCYDRQAGLLICRSYLCVEAWIMQCKDIPHLYSVYTCKLG